MTIWGFLRLVNSKKYHNFCDIIKFQGSLKIQLLGYYLSSSQNKERNKTRNSFGNVINKPNETRGKFVYQKGHWTLKSCGEVIIETKWPECLASTHTYMHYISEIF